MKIQEVTPNIAPIPRTFDLGLDAVETTALVALLKSSLSAVPEAASSGVMNFFNIRFTPPTTTTPQTSHISVQFAPVPAMPKPAVAAAVVLPAPSSPAPEATPTAAPATAPAASTAPKSA